MKEHATAGCNGTILTRPRFKARKDDFTLTYPDHSLPRGDRLGSEFVLPW